MLTNLHDLLRDLMCAVIGHRVVWVASPFDETPICRRCDKVVPDEQA
jgi:hypothetical protein